MLCEVVAAFLHNPKIVFLDEPTIGLDVAVKDSIRTLIKPLYVYFFFCNVYV